MDWAIKKFPNDDELGKIMRKVYQVAIQNGNTAESWRDAEQDIMVEHAKK